MINEGNIVLLSDNIKYIVVKSLYGERVNYYYVYKLVEDEKQFKILKEEDNKYSVIEDQNVLDKFLELMK
ncbi:MAG: hypothetical protein IKC11_01300 [Clostridia bacterium]|nr:hypothetical protein [Clostridia bacterium]